MACGGCAERRGIIVKAAAALGRGDLEEARRQVEAFEQSTRQDASALVRRAKSRLSGKRA